jgi:hypothetical protein
VRHAWVCGRKIAACVPTLPAPVCMSCGGRRFCLAQAFWVCRLHDTKYSGRRFCLAQAFWCVGCNDTKRSGRGGCLVRLRWAWATCHQSFRERMLLALVTLVWGGHCRMHAIPADCLLWACCGCIGTWACMPAWLEALQPAWRGLMQCLLYASA